MAFAALGHWPSFKDRLLCGKSGHLLCRHSIIPERIESSLTTNLFCPRKISATTIFSAPIKSLAWQRMQQCTFPRRAHLIRSTRGSLLARFATLVRVAQAAGSRSAALLVTHKIKMGVRQQHHLLSAHLRLRALVNSSMLTLRQIFKPQSANLKKTPSQRIEYHALF